MKVAVYLAAVPAKTKNQHKKEFLRNFAHGVAATGDEALLVEDNSVVDADIAVLQGWVGMKSAAHLELRRRVIHEQRRRGQHTLIIDSNLFGFLDPKDRDRYLRYSLDGIFPTTGYYFDKNPDPSRWEEIKRNYNFQEHEWRQHGKEILICLQRDGGWSMDGLSVTQWLTQIIQKLKSTTDRDLVIRPHPGSLSVIPGIKNCFPDIKISENPDIRTDLDTAWCTITYNSSPGVASLLWGVPTFITDPDPRRSQIHGYASYDLDQIEKPFVSDRTDLYHRLAQCHFLTSSLVSGDAWRFMRARLP
jgi:hypothetical protein